MVLFGKIHGCQSNAFLFRQSYHSPIVARRSYFLRKTRGFQIRETLEISISRKRFFLPKKLKVENSTKKTRSTSTEARLSNTWRDIQGQNDWAGLLDPLDPLLRSELARYGDMAQACYDAFDSDPSSKYCGSCKYSAEEFFQALGLTKHGYEVTRYLYAIDDVNIKEIFKRSLFSNARSRNWMGFIAVSNDKTSLHLGRRDITVAWRGTVTDPEFMEGLMHLVRLDALTNLPICPDPKVKVESSFLDLYIDKDGSNRARESALEEIRRLIHHYKYEDVSITITGHSIGSAVAILNAYDIAETGVNVKGDGKVIPISAFTYGGPRVGNVRFKERLEQLGVKVLRLVNKHDVVTKIPGIFLNERGFLLLQKLGEAALSQIYSHVGVELSMDHKHSPFLKQTTDPSTIHGLDTYLHLLDRVSERADPKRTLMSKVESFLREIIKLEKSKKWKGAKRSEVELSDIWHEIHGEDDWSGLLEPLNPLLQSELIRYGDMAQVCYDAFDSDPYSKYCGSCKYSTEELFQSLGLTKHGYEVTRYLYAAGNMDIGKFYRRSMWPKAWSRNANWVGYVAVSDDRASLRLGRRDIVVAWRGTVTGPEFVEDLMYSQRPVTVNKIHCSDPQVKVESAFLDFYAGKDVSCHFCKHSPRETALVEIRRLIHQYHDEDLSITITGHSLGSAIAILNAYDVAETHVHIKDNGRVVPICAFSFAGPRIGNTRFKKRLESLGVKVLRVVNIHDKVTDTPVTFLNERRPPAVQKLSEMSSWNYSHVGVELSLDHRISPFLKKTIDQSCIHNLEVYLHLLDGYHGKCQRFVLSGERDIALVNKSTDFLKDHHLIPPNWWQSETRGLKRNHKGFWMQPDIPYLSFKA